MLASRRCGQRLFKAATLHLGGKWDELRLLRECAHLQQSLGSDERDTQRERRSNRSRSFSSRSVVVSNPGFSPELRRVQPRRSFPSVDKKWTSSCTLAHRRAQFQ